MAKLIYGERIGRQARLRCGCSAAIFDPTGEKLLLTRRSDNGRWCLPGGAMDPGERAAEACAREVWEETGLQVEVTRLIGVYSSPDVIVEYADGNRFQVLALHFEAQVTGGELGLSSETTQVGFFTLQEMEGMDVMENHRERIHDTFARLPEARIR